MNEPARVNTWRSADLMRAIALFFATWIVLRFFWLTRSVLLITTLSILFGVTLARGVDMLERRGVRRGIGTVLLLLLVFGSLIGAGFLLAPSLQRQTQELSRQFPAAIKQIEEKVAGKPLARAALGAAAQAPQQQTQTAKEPASSSPSTESTGQDRPAGGRPEQQAQKGGAESGGGTGGLTGLVQSHAGQFVQMLFPFLSNSLAAIAGLLVVIFLAAYFGAEPKTYQNGLVSLFPPPRRARTREVLGELGDLLRQWMLARLSAMVIIGLITGGALALLGIPAAGALGVIAGLLEFVPFVGPIAAAVPAIALALIVSPTKALYVVILFVILQQLEGNVITPLLMKNRLDVPPAVTIIAVAALGMVFGILGMLIAEPLSAAVILLAKRLYVEPLESLDEQPAG